MLVIRLMRTGKIHAPHYRIVVQEKRSKLNGKAVDTIGHYHPAQSDKLLVIDKEKADQWLKKGAQPSDTVTNLLVKEGILDKKRKVTQFFTAKKVEKAEEAPAPAEEPTAEEPAAEEAPATDTPAEEAAEVQPEETATPSEETPENEPAEAPASEETKEEAAPETDTAA